MIYSAVDNIAEPINNKRFGFVVGVFFPYLVCKTDPGLAKGLNLTIDCNLCQQRRTHAGDPIRSIKVQKSLYLL